MLRFSFKIIISFFVMYYTFIASAEICIKITQKNHSAYPIGIVSFAQNKKISKIEKIDEIIFSDLTNSGKFYLIPWLQHPEQPTDISEITAEKWTNLGINTIVIGQINKIDQQYSISYQIIDLSEKENLIILKNQYIVSKTWIRYAAHTISNDIFEKITGMKGNFCTKIAFITCDYKKKYFYKLYISDYDGFNKTLIYSSSEPLMSPAWSTDGKRLAYVIFEKSHSILVLHDLYTGSINRLVDFNNHNGAPAFSPDGKKLAFASSKTGSLNLYVMDLTSKKIYQITNERNNNTEPSWFPDNYNLAYTSDRSGTPQIYKININNGISKRLTWSNYTNQNAHVSSDGTFLIMISRNNTDQYVTKLNLSTGINQILTDTISDETLTLSPNNSMIIYSTLSTKNSILHLISINTGFKITLPISGDEYIRFPKWSPYIE